MQQKTDMTVITEEHECNPMLCPFYDTSNVQKMQRQKLVITTMTTYQGSASDQLFLRSGCLKTSQRPVCPASHLTAHKQISTAYFPCTYAIIALRSADAFMSSLLLSLQDKLGCGALAKPCRLLQTQQRLATQPKPLHSFSRDLHICTQAPFTADWAVASCCINGSLSV